MLIVVLSDRFPSMFTSVGVAASAGVAAALMVCVSILPTIAVQMMGRGWRGVKEAEIASDQEKEVESKVEG
jgi:hypothetical protein